MKIVYIAHPIAGNVEENLSDLRRIIKKINTTMPDIVPFVPYYSDVVSTDDSIPEMRLRGIKNDHELIRRGFIDQCWLTGKRLSSGMIDEKNLFHSLGIKVIDMLNEF